MGGIPKHPFLGVHFTRTLDGAAKIGPTAIPALWREQYGGLGRCKPGELLAVAGRQLLLFAANRNGFRRLAWQELRKQSKASMEAGAAKLIPGCEQMGFNQWGRPGIRAQLLDRRSGTLEMDFVIEGDSRSLHVLNAVSPALTCALPFAAYAVDQMEQKTA